MTDSETVNFELIELSSGNVVNDFADVAEALTAVRRVAGLHGVPAVHNLALLRLDGDEQTLVAIQASLADLATAERAPATTRTS
ncbi:MAG: hypothetical protein K0Q71_2881 [Thermomicrobiales bacterium]|nr:hypothetical protein [Thermomicrobiales bacterium]